MKTPKRNADEKRGRYARHYLIIDRSRWKRKNRVAQLKRTIARLTAESKEFRELWRGEHLKAHSPEWDAFMILRRLKTPARRTNQKRGTSNGATYPQSCKAQYGRRTSGSVRS